MIFVSKTKSSDDEDSFSCDGCDICCRYINIVAMPPKDMQDIDRMIWYIYHGAVIYVDNGVWRVNIDIPCLHLGSGYCKIYNDRLDICRKYSNLTCERYNMSEINVTVLKTKEELLEYAKEELGIS